MAGPPELIRPSLRELHWLSTDRCRAVFEEEDGERVEALFAVRRGDPNAEGVRAFDLVTEETGLMDRFDGTGEEVRSFWRLVGAFCHAAQHGPLPDE
jgi:hypothetical protein